MKLWKNRDVQMFFAAIVIACLVLGCSLFFIVNKFVSEVNTIQIKQNVSTIGLLAKQYPERETEIAGIYTSDKSGDYDYGSKILEKYSYYPSLSPDKSIKLIGEYNKFYILILILIILFTLSLAVIFIKFGSNIYKKVRLLSTGAESVIEGTYQPLQGDKNDGDLGLLIHQFNIMTERLNETVESLKEEKFFLKRLTTDISHQLKTPLASLIMFNDIMTADMDMPVDQRIKFLNESKNQLERIEWLIKNLLKMAKLEARVVEFVKEEAPLGETIYRSISALTFIAEEKNIKIEVTGDREIKVRHDINWTTEAISNILKNCIEHSNKDGKIQIAFENNNVFAQIVIRDNGCGIEKAELPKIFDRFYKGINSCNPTNIGVGLYIAKTVIEDQGGTIYVSSEVNKGTQFTIRLMNIE
jgi:signal transduction histidine kinase